MEPTRPHRMSRVLTGIVAGIIAGLVFLLGKSGLAAFRLDRGPTGYVTSSRASR